MVPTGRNAQAQGSKGRSGDGNCFLLPCRKGSVMPFIARRMGWERKNGRQARVTSVYRGLCGAVGKTLRVTDRGIHLLFNSFFGFMLPAMPRPRSVLVVPSFAVLQSEAAAGKHCLVVGNARTDGGQQVAHDGGIHAAA